MKQLMKNKLIILLLSVLMLGGCSFSLGPQQQLPAQLHTLYLETDNPYGSLESSLRKVFHSSNVTFVDSAQAATMTLQLSKPTKTNSGATVGPSSQSRIYVIKYVATYTLKDKQDKILLGPRELSSTRSLVLNANQLLQSNNQLSSLYTEMERDIVMQLYSQLRSEKAAQALAKTAP